MKSADIKNLCIALEALSRVQGTKDLSTRIRKILENLIKSEEPKNPLFEPIVEDLEEIPF